MSPNAFAQQVAQLVTELEKCYDLCQLIRTNRRMGSTTSALDKLQHDLLNSATSIDSSFRTLHSIMGSRMDLGDEISRSALNHSIHELQHDIQSRLTEVAYDRHIEAPGFRKLNDRWNKINLDVKETIEALGQRLKAHQQTPKSAMKESKKENKVPRHDEAIISLEKLDDLVEHMKNSWEEKLDRESGQFYYVNAFDRKKVQWERPSGAYIKTSSKKTVSVQEPEERGSKFSRREESEYSNYSKGW